MPDLNRDWAVRLAEAGIAVFPCGHDKKPLVKWRAESSCDANTVAQWWSQFPSALPGIDLEKSDLVVLDGDRHGGPDGRTALRNLLLQQAGFSLRSTPSVLTPGDGVHCYFKRNGHALTNSRGELPEGIDVRGIGGYVIAYAVLPDERRYRAVPNTPDLIAAFQSGSIPHVPQGIVDLIKARKDNSEQPRPKQAASASNTAGIRETSWAEAALNGGAGELAKCAAGGRNEALNAIAYRMGRMIARGWLDRGHVEAVLTGSMYANGYLGEEGPKRVTETLKNGLDAGVVEPHPDLEPRPGTRNPGSAKTSNSGEKQTLPEGVSLDDFRAYMPLHNFIYLPSREPWPGSSVNARLGKVPHVDADGKPVLNDKGEQENQAASTWLDQNRPVEQATWAPGLPMRSRTGS